MQGFWSLLNFLNPNLFADWAAFDRKFDAIKILSQDEATMAELTILTKAFMLRRKKEDLLPVGAIPAYSEHIFIVDMTTEQLNGYKQVLSSPKFKFQQLQDVANPKTVVMMVAVRIDSLRLSQQVPK